MTFGDAVAQWRPRAPILRNPKSEPIRERALAIHLAPIRDQPLTAITPADMVEILVPLRPETAMRVYGVAKAVFAFGAVLLEPEGVDLRSPTDLAKLRASGLVAAFTPVAQPDARPGLAPRARALDGSGSRDPSQSLASWSSSSPRRRAAARSYGQAQEHRPQGEDLDRSGRGL